MEKFDHIKKLMSHFTEIGPSGCSVNISLKGKTVFEHFEGYGNIQTEKRIDENSIYRIYSSTKPITVVALLQLYERGLLLLNDPLERYIPEFANPKVVFYTGNNLSGVRPAKSSIRIRDLLCMTSGITYEGDISVTHNAISAVTGELEKKGGYSLLEFVKKLAEAPLLFDPGTSWNYSYSIDVVGALVEIISGKTFGQYLKDEIFTPLGMENTWFFLPEVKKENLTTLYYRDENGKLKENKSVDYKYSPSYRFESGGGGLLSTLGDMARFAQMLSMGGTLGDARILGRKTIDLMRQNHLTTEQLEAFQRAHANNWEFLEGYGYGLGVRTMIDCARGGSNGSIGEFGWAGAAGTWMLVDMSEQLAVTYMHQLMPKNMEGYCHPRLRAAIYGSLK